VTASVRAARMSDAAAICELTAQLGYDVAASAVTERLSRILSRSDQQFLVAELDGRPVGWIHLLSSEYIESGPSVSIGGLVVDSNHRRNGIGRILMHRAEVWARERGCPIVRLRSSSTRDAAHRFYEHLGYVHVKTQYSFVKSLDGREGEGLERFVPQVHKSGG
jgi:GNAT superfamily N-acetyltransferase